MPTNHELAAADVELDLPTLSAHPLVTYVFSLTGESSFKNAFTELGLEPDVVFTARDADIIKTYVRMGMGVGVVAGLAYECSDEEDLVSRSAEGCSRAAPPGSASAAIPCCAVTWSTSSPCSRRTSSRS